MSSLLSPYTRRKTFISYHHEDEDEVSAFIDYFDHGRDILISRGIGASMAGDVIGSKDATYIKQRIRSLYLRDSTVTIVLIGRYTWSRQFVDWEIAASLRNTSTSKRNGIVAITLPSAAEYVGKRVPERIKDNLDGEKGYARWMKYPQSSASLGRMIDDAYNRRDTHALAVNNTRPLYSRNRSV